MNNELFDIPQQGDARTKDWKEKLKFTMTSLVESWKQRKSVWFEENSISEELDVGQIFFCKNELSMRLSVMTMNKVFSL